MKKRIISLVCTLCLLLMLFPTTAFAGTYAAPIMSVAASFDAATNQVTATVTLGAYTDLGGLDFHLKYDTTKLTVNGTPTGEGILADVDNTTITPNADNIGVSYVKASGVSSTTTAEVLKVVFNVNAGQVGAAVFTFDSNVTNFADKTGNDTSDTAGAGSVLTATAMIYSELTGAQAVTLGSPSKGGTVSAITASGPANTTAAVKWYADTTEFTGTTFAASTAYTAAVMLTAASGYKFASTATATVAGATVTGTTVAADGSTLSFKAAFPPTDSRTLMTLTITDYTGGAKTDGDTVAKSELTVTATFDAGAADTAYTDYDVAYNTGTALKKGDTSFKVKKGTVESTAYTISAVAGKTPTAGLFTFTAPSLTYTGADQQDAVKSAVTYTKTAEAGAATYSFQKKAGETWSAAADVTAAGDYRILAAVAGGTEYAAASEITVGEFTVAKAAQTATKPSIATYSDTDIAATAVTNQKYQIKKSGETAPTAASTGWADSASFTGLDCNTTYRVYTYLPGDANHSDSPVVYTEQKTNKTELSGTVTVSDTTPEFQQELTAVVTSVAPTAAQTGLTYQWYRESTAIAGATTASHTVTAADVGYTLKVEVTAAADGNYTGSLTSTDTSAVGAKNVAAAREPVSQTIVKGVGTFTEPAFGDVTGTLTYTYASTNYTYNNLVNVLKALDAAAMPVVTWTYEASGNYTGTITGTINFTVVDIAFTVGGDSATVSNALTVKASPVYGDTWAAIVSKKANVTAAVGTNNDTDQSHFTLDVTGSPDAGSGQTYKLVYNGTIGGVNYANVTVCSGAVNVAQREAVISWANTTDRVYNDGKTVTAAITNKVGSDNVSITVTGGTETAVGSHTATAALAGAKAANYKLPTVHAKDYTIAKATPTGAPKYTAITAADKTLEAAALTTTGGTFSVLGTVKWVDSSNNDLAATTKVTANTSYKWLFTPTDTANYNTLTGSITPYVVSYGGGEVSFTLTFSTNGGSAVAAVSKTSGTTVDLSAYKPTRSGYTFAGWCSDEALTTAVTSVKLTANTTVYARWTMVNPFIDVHEGDYFFDAVLWAAAKGVTNGTTPTTFAPFMNCTRAQVVTFLWRATGSPKAAATVNPFSDVKPDAYYYDAVLWAVEQGITKGTSDTAFSPDAAVTRAQFVTLLWRLAGKHAPAGANPFTDVKTGTYYYDAVVWAEEKEITTGATTTTFNPNGVCDRGQIMAFLYRYFGK